MHPGENEISEQERPKRAETGGDAQTAVNEIGVEMNPFNAVRFLSSKKSSRNLTYAAASQSETLRSATMDGSNAKFVMISKDRQDVVEDKDGKFVMRNPYSVCSNVDLHRPV
jgi:hypothetical protein